MVEFSPLSPHCLVAQDAALSRPKHEFEPRWGHLKTRSSLPSFHCYNHCMLTRSIHLQDLEIATRRSPITALLGPRQVGKTTLAHIFTANQPVTFFDLESLPDQRRLQNPELVLSSLQGLVVLDEIQQMPELFSTLRVLVDRSANQAHGDQ